MEFDISLIFMPTSKSTISYRTIPLAAFIEIRMSLELAILALMIVAIAPLTARCRWISDLIPAFVRLELPSFVS